jgi:hypothetical protein
MSHFTHTRHTPRCHRQVLVAAFVASTLLRVSILGAGSAAAMFWLLLVGELLGAPINVIGDSTVLSNCQQARHTQQCDLAHPMHDSMQDRQLSQQVHPCLLDTGMH